MRTNAAAERAVAEAGIPTRSERPMVKRGDGYPVPERVSA